MSTKGPGVTRRPEVLTGTPVTLIPFQVQVEVDGPSTCRRSPPSHVGSIKAVRRITVGVAVLATHVVAGLLRGVHLGLQCGRIGVDPLELLEVAVEHTNDLAKL